MIDLKALKLTTTDVCPALPPRVRVVQMRSGRFLKGPIDWAWISRAGKGVGRALHVGIALWLERGMTGADAVRLSYARLKDMGVDRHAGRRGLAELERLGLVSVARNQGRSPVVTILPVQNQAEYTNTLAP